MRQSSKLTKESICAVIQATYNSNVFPGKSMVIIAGKTVLEHIVERIRKVKSVSDIILSTSTIKADDLLVNEALRLNIKVLRGDEIDVVSRLCDAVENIPCETIVKVNGNCPLFDSYLANDLISLHIKGDYDFSYNEPLNGTLYGAECEVIKKEILFDLNKKELTIAQRQAGTLYFHQNENKYKVNKFKYSKPRPCYKVCLETKKDLKLIELIFKVLKDPYTDQIVEFLDDNPALAEINKYESVQEVGLEKLYLFPEKIASIKNINFSKPDIAYPISVELSLTNRCNLNCIWCSDMDLRASQDGEMDFEVLKRLLLDLKQGGSRGVVIEGGGEPAIYKYFNEVIEFIHNLGLDIGLITNGNVRLELSIAKEFDWIRISLDASNQYEHKKLKGQDSFEDIMSNIKELCNLEIMVGIGYVVTTENVGSLESLILRLSEFGVRYIQFRPVVDHPELEHEIDLTYLKRYEHDRFAINIDGMRENTFEGNDSISCRVHSLTTVITADGSVYLCGRLNIHTWFEPIGNINSESFHDIWFGEKRLKQSNLVLDQGFCKKYCPKCRLTKYNQLFHRIEKIKTKNFI